MLSLKTEHDVVRETAELIRRQRIAVNMTQAELAEQSGVPLGTLRRFEQTGQGGFMTVAKILTTLGTADHFLSALKRPAPTARTLDAFISARSQEPERQRVRRTKSGDAKLRT
jgi:transcriptional regulator with XRE-family HTH domain